MKLFDLQLCCHASTQHSYMNENTVNSIPFCVSADQQIILICTFQETLPKIKEYCPFTVSDTNALDALFLLPLHKCCSGSSRSSMALKCHPQCHSRVRVGKCTPQPFKACQHQLYFEYDFSQGFAGKAEPASVKYTHGACLYISLW